MSPPSEFDWAKRPYQRIAFFKVSDTDLKDRLRELTRSYCWTVVPLSGGNRGVIFYPKPSIYYSSVTPLDSEYGSGGFDDNLRAVGLMIRALGVVPPNLSSSEWRQLYLDFGYSRKEAETKAKRLVSRVGGEEPKSIDKIGECVELVCNGRPDSLDQVVSYLVSRS